MKRIATLLPLIITSMSIQAGNSDVYCEKIAQVADMAMEFRQMNMPMSYQLEEVPDGAIIIRKIIMDAYEKPGYSSKPMRFEAQMKFRNDWHLQCLKADKAWE